MNIIQPCCNYENNSKFIFIGIPKSCCTFMKNEFMKINPNVTYYSHSRCLSNNFLKKHDNNNYTWVYPLLDVPNFHKNIKFTIIRNPFDLLISHFESRWCDYCISVKKKLDRVSVRQNIINFCKREPKDWYLPMLSRFLYFQLFDEYGKSRCNYAIIYDGLEQGLKEFCNKFNLKIPTVNTHNVTINKKKYKDYYNDDLIKLVNIKCKLELSLFNFNFNGYQGKDFLIDISNLYIDPNILKS